MHLEIQINMFNWLKKKLKSIFLRVLICLLLYTETKTIDIIKISFVLTRFYTILFCVLSVNSTVREPYTWLSKR